MSKKPRLVVLSGAGISAESGLATFRDGGGLWESYRVEEVATPEAWARDPLLVNRFYNMRRRAVKEAQPNAAHIALAELERYFDVHIITQNIDDLHERAGSTRVLHLHGEIFKMRCPVNAEEVRPIYEDITETTLSTAGYMMRPHIVWFGENVEAMPEAERIMSTAEVILVVGTSLQVYPAAGLLYDAPTNAIIYAIDPSLPQSLHRSSIHCIEAKATEGIKVFVRDLYQRFDIKVS